MKISAWWMFCCMMTPVWIATAAHADSSARAEPYCGLYAVFAAAEYHGLRPEFLPLLDRRYLGCSRGSSMEELRQAAEDMGMTTLIVTNMWSSVLRRSKHPVILHVRAEPASLEYDHYILFIGHDGRNYVCIDGEHIFRLGNRSCWPGGVGQV